MTLPYGPTNPDTYVSHGYPEATADLGEIDMNYAVAGDASAPPVLLVPGQIESWWGYEAVMRQLEAHHRVYAVDLRGQGRSSWTPGRYTFDNFGNDLVRFIQLVIRRPTVVAGNSSGGILAGWLGAYAPPGLVRGVYMEDPPLFSCEVAPSYSPGGKQISLHFLLQLYSTYLGDQWKVGDWKGMQDNAPAVLPPFLLPRLPQADGPPQNLKEYDPEWARSFLTGSVVASCDHKRMLERMKVPVLFSHHMCEFDAQTGIVDGATTELQVQHVRRLVESAGQPFVLKSLPDKPHQLHQKEPDLYVSMLRSWVERLP